MAGVVRDAFFATGFPLEVRGLVRYTTSRISFQKSKILYTKYDLLLNTLKQTRHTSRDLTRRWAKGPANLVSRLVSSFSLVYFSFVSFSLASSLVSLFVCLLASQ